MQTLAEYLHFNKYMRFTCQCWHYFLRMVLFVVGDLFINNLSLHRVVVMPGMEWINPDFEMLAGWMWLLEKCNVTFIDEM